MAKKKLKKDVWEKSTYYELINDIKLTWSQPGMSQLKKLAKKSNIILDLGCGEGSRLLKVEGETTAKLFGVDISKTAIKEAKVKLKKANLVVGDLENLPYDKDEFDLIYSFFVFEHLDNPEKVIDEVDRVLKNSGYFIVVCPNYGSPNRSSPPFTGSRMNKLINGGISDLMNLFTKKSNTLDWNKVEPIADNKNYQVDWDTTVEPYVLTLTKYLKSKGFKIVVSSSSWYATDNNEKFHQKIFKALGEIGFYPFKHWGPQVEIVAQKK